MTKIHTFVVAALIACATPVNAQMHASAVQADRVGIGAEYVPRRLDLPNKKIVAAGETYEPPAEATFDYIEGSGTIRVSRTRDTNLVFTHLINLPGGVLDIGTQADPIPCNIKVELVIRDVPIDTTKDPFQWGNGLVNFGTQTRVGCAKTAFLEANPMAKGDTFVTLTAVPVNWQVGDELLIPDTAQPSVVKTASPAGNEWTSRREARVTIAAIAGTRITLSKPLDFEHNDVVAPNGTLVLRPRVANLTRNIKIRSENPDGTRGHTVDVGMEAHFDLEYNEFEGLGRTLNQRIDNTVLPRIGTNQIAKYAMHHHHVASAVGSIDRGNVLRGHPARGKWGLVVHGTSDALVEENIAIDFPGAGFITEDGYEVRNVFRHNFAAYVHASVPGIGLTQNAGQRLITEEVCPGCEGSGFWLRSIMNTFEGNEGWNSLRGINFFNQQQVSGKYPSVPGGPSNTPNQNHLMLPISVKGNVAVGNSISGWEFWATGIYPNVGLIAASNRGTQVIGVQSDGPSHFYQNPTIVCPGSQEGNVGIHTDFGYTHSFEIQGGYIGNCWIGVIGGGGRQYERIIGTTLQNVTNIHSVPGTASFVHENVMHLPLGTSPHDYIRFNGSNFNAMNNPAYIWNGTDPLPKLGTSAMLPGRGSQAVIKNWQGTGKDYRIIPVQSLGSNPAYYSTTQQHAFNCPVQGLTWEQCWDRYGLSYGGDMLKASEAKDLDGLIYGKVREGLALTLPPPRAVVTLPTMREPALGPSFEDPAKTGYVKIFAAITGDPVLASDKMWYSVDGDPPSLWGSHGETADLDQRPFNTRHAEVGKHTVSVWRVQADGVTELPGSKFTTPYCVGDINVCTDNQPPSTNVLVPNVVGQTEAEAAATLVAQKLTKGVSASANSATVPVGQVINQNPVAGTNVMINSSVALVLSLGPAIPPPGTVTVPDVVGRSLTAANTALTALGLKAAPTTATSTTVAYGNVISQNPAAGTLVNPGSTVIFVLSIGKPPPSAMVAVPNVVGKTQTAASADIVGAKLAVGSIDNETNPAPFGQVIRQSPVAGITVPVGSAVNLVFSSGPVVTPPATTTYTFTCDAAGNCKLVKQP